MYYPHLQKKLPSFFFDILALANEIDTLSRNFIKKHKIQTSEDLNISHPNAQT